MRAPTVAAKARFLCHALLNANNCCAPVLFRFLFEPASSLACGICTPLCTGGGALHRSRCDCLRRLAVSWLIVRRAACLLKGREQAGLIGESERWAKQEIRSLIEGDIIEAS